MEETASKSWGITETRSESKLSYGVSQRLEAKVN